MNCFHLVKKLRNVRDWYKLTIYEQALFHELVFVCNEKGWPKYFICSNEFLAGALMVSKRTIIRLREKLCACGLVSYQSGNRRRSCVYSLSHDVSTGKELSSAIIFDIPEFPVQEQGGKTPASATESDSFDITDEVISDKTEVENDTLYEVMGDKSATGMSVLYKTKTKQTKHIKAKNELLSIKRELATEDDWLSMLNRRLTLHILPGLLFLCGQLCLMRPRAP